MIILYLKKDGSMKAEGLIPGDTLQVHFANGSIWNVTRFGSVCTSKCIEEAKEEKEV